MSSLEARDVLGLDVEQIELLLKYLNYASHFDDFPKNFTFPSLTTPNYVPPDRSRPLVVLVWVSTAFILLVVGARLCVRTFVRRIDYGLDDWLMIPSLFFALSLSVILLLLIKFGGVGRHVYDLDVHTLNIASRLEFGGILAYFLSVYFTKLSICAFYARLFGGRGSAENKILFATCIVYTGICITSIAVFTFACRPISAIWLVSKRLEEYKCLDLTGILLAYGIILTIADLWLLILPIRKIIRLALPIQIKLALIFIFALGGIAVGGAILKILNVQTVYNTFDPTWNSIPFMFGAQIESAAAIITASLPALNFLWVNLLPTWLRSKIFEVCPPPHRDDNRYLTRQYDDDKQLRTKTSRDLLDDNRQSMGWYGSNVAVNETYFTYSVPASSKIMSPYGEILVHDMPVFYDTHLYEHFVQDYPQVRHLENPEFLQERTSLEKSAHTVEAPARPDAVAWPLRA